MSIEVMHPGIATYYTAEAVLKDNGTKKSGQNIYTLEFAREIQEVIAGLGETRLVDLYQ